MNTAPNTTSTATTSAQAIEAPTINNGSTEGSTEAMAILEQIIGKFKVLKELLAQE